MRKFQFYNTDDDNDRDIYAGNWGGQTFTPAIPHIIGKVKLKLFRVGDPGLVTVSIKATISGKPAGSALCSGTIVGNTLTENSAGEWYEITLGNGFEVTKGVQYSIEAKAPDGDASNKLSWRADITDPTFTGGTYCTSTDSGVDWATVSGVDCMFEEWGVLPPSLTTVVWGNLVKSQISAERIEEAILRLIQNHEDDEDAHIEAGESLYSHKASEIIDHIANSIINDKILAGVITNPKINIHSRAYHAIVDAGGDADYTDIQDAIDYVAGLGLNGGKILVLPGTYEPPADLILPSNLDMEGLDPLTTIIDFQQIVTRRLEAIGGARTYSTGTITVTADDATIVGDTTLWDGEIEAGDYIQIHDSWFKIASVTDDTHLELDQIWRGKTEAGLTYKAATMLENISLKNITVKGGGNVAGQPGPGNAFFEHCIDLLIENCPFLEAPGVGAFFNKCSRVTFKNNLPQKNTEAGVAFAFVTDSFINNNKGSGGERMDFSFGYCHKNTISNNLSPGCKEDSFVFYLCHRNTIIGNKSEKNILSGFKFTECEDNTILGNISRDNTLHGFHLYKSSNNALNGNIAKDNDADGVFIDNILSSKNLIIGNQLQDNAGEAIDDDGTDTVAANNIL